MEDSRVCPHILRRPLKGKREAVADVTVEGTRALLVFADGEAAGEFMDRTPGTLADSEAVPVSPAEISGVCANHGLALVALYGFPDPGDLSVMSVEAVPWIFGR
jgi:hypothetical protein